MVKKQRGMGKRARLDSVKFRLNKKLVIVLLIFVALSIVPLRNTVKGAYAVWNNKNTDFSCVTDADCIPREFKCGCCGGSYCANVNSPEILCRNEQLSYCGEMECPEVPKTNCLCVNNECVDKAILNKLNKNNG